MATWMINIEGEPGAAAHFVPQLQAPGPNGQANVSQGDRVDWFNNTETTHQIEAASDSNFTTIVYRSDPIPKDGSSRPSLQATEKGTIYYRCALHHGENSTIVVW